MSLKIIQIGTIRKLGCAFHSNYGSILYQFRYKATYGSKIVIFIARQHTDARTDARYWCNNPVRPSVRQTPVLDENGLTYFYSFFTTR